MRTDATTIGRSTGRAASSRPGAGSRRPPRAAGPRGFTLVEMLVAVALLVLMMTIIATIFASATGAITVSRTYQELDGNLQQLDATIRRDLAGVTVKLTPPANPDDNGGYMEIGENQFADIQGEDTDDYIRFTAKAPEGQLFSGRFYVNLTPTQINNMTSAQILLYQHTQPITIYSQYAEIIYFLRNGNLYRRVLLIVPERQLSVSERTIGSNLNLGPGQFSSVTFNHVLGWMGVNDVSARPQINPNIGTAGTLNRLIPKLNTLADLTNRHNRPFYPRFSDDYFDIRSGTPVAGEDGVTDDLNGDTVPDLYPTLYPAVFNNTGLINPNIHPFATGTPTTPHTLDTLAFPYIFPGAFSQPDPSSGTMGMLHGLGPSGNPIINGVAQPNPYPTPYGHFYVNGVAFTASAANPAYRPNHAPLESGDTLTTPNNVSGATLQTWWGFPTWRETASPNWVDPIWSINDSSHGTKTQATGLSWVNHLNGNGYLPPLNDPNIDVQPFTDGVPAAAAGTAQNPFAFLPAIAPRIYRDDLIMQGVRSFDIKVYDDSVPAYVDLGYANYTQGVTNNDTIPSPFANAAQLAQALLGTMGHEGRIPPLTTDFRTDPNSGLNVGDNQSGVLRLRRVWDSWSTDYSNAPATGIDANGFPIGPPFSQPVYPSYPPPYPAPLRGVQIQLRVVDPRNERIKTLTIRQDFSDKL